MRKPKGAQLAHISDPVCCILFVWCVFVGSSQFGFSLVTCFLAFLEWALMHCGPMHDPNVGKQDVSASVPIRATTARDSPKAPEVLHSSSPTQRRRDVALSGFTMLRLTPLVHTNRPKSGCFKVVFGPMLGIATSCWQCTFWDVPKKRSNKKNPKTRATRGDLGALVGAPLCV